MAWLLNFGEVGISEFWVLRDVVHSVVMLVGSLRSAPWLSVAQRWRLHPVGLYCSSLNDRSIQLEKINPGI